MVASKKSKTQAVRAKRTILEPKAGKTKLASQTEGKITIDRRTSSDRRVGNTPVAVEERTLERRAKVNRRRQIDPTTCERDYSVDEIEFMSAMDEYKRRNGRMFPTCSEVLEVIKSLGYEKRLPVADAPLPTLPLPVIDSFASTSL